jgi:hypothetical protein
LAAIWTQLREAALVGNVGTFDAGKVTARPLDEDIQPAASVNSSVAAANPSISLDKMSY